MYLTPYQKKQLVTTIILVIGVPLTIFGIYKGAQLIINASVESQPRNVILSNLTTSSIAVTWTTEDKVTGSVVPILNTSEQGPVIDKRGNEKRRTHYVELKNLEPNTDYSFKIISGEDTYSGDSDNQFTFTTANISTETPVPKPIHGKVGTSNGDDVLIYAFPKDKTTYPIATVPSSNGNWLMDISSLRKISDRSMYLISETTQVAVIGVSKVNDAGIIEGGYSSIFNSSGQLTQDLVPNGTGYISYFNEDIQLYPFVEGDTEIIPPDTDDDNDDVPIDDDDDNNGTPTDDDSDDYTPPDNTYVPPNNNTNPTQPDYVPPADYNDPYDTPFRRNFLIKNDLAWIDMVSTDGALTSGPEVYGESTVITTNVTDVSFSVLWFSQQEETGYIMYGTNASELSERGRDERDGISSQGEYYLHSIEVTQLQPETTYYFEIHSGTQTFSNTYEVSTFATQSTPPEFETIAGNVNAQDYQSVAIVAIFSDRDGIGSEGSSYPISTLVDVEGSWILTTGGARESGGGYFDKSNNDVVTFSPMYLNEPPEVEMTIGDATSSEVELYITENVLRFIEIPLLSDYGILSN